MLITSIMGVEWRLPSSTDEQRGSQADQWVLSGGHTTTTTNTRGILVKLVMCVMVGHRKLKIEIIKLLTILC